MERASQQADALKGQSPSRGNVDALRKFHRRKEELKKSNKNLSDRYQESASVKSQQGSLCHRCARDHRGEKCRFADAICRYCKKKGHIERACRAKPRAIRQMNNQNSSKSDEDEILLHSLSSKGSKYSVDLYLNGHKVQMELDTGARVSLIPQTLWRKLGKRSLQPSNCELKTWSGQKVEILGTTTVHVNYNDQTKDLPLFVTKNNGQALLGRTWIEQMKLDWKSIFSMNLNSGLEILKEEYKELFDESKEPVKDFKVTLVLKENAQPKFMKARSLPFAMKASVEEELDRLQTEGIIEKVTRSEWATPIVPIVKSDGKSLRICGDYKTTLNPQLKIDHHPLPNAQEMYHSMLGGEKFSKLDLKQAYLQLELAENTKDLTTINTHQGLYRYNRLSFGISSAPAVCQELLDKTLHGLRFTCGRIDDIIVSGKNDEEHLQNLKAVFSRLRERGLRLNKEKCSFMQDELENLGSVVDKHGTRKSPKKIEAVRVLQEPHNVTQLRENLGLMTYYHHFVKDFGRTAAPLHDLL